MCFVELPFRSTLNYHVQCHHDEQLHDTISVYEVGTCRLRTDSLPRRPIREVIYCDTHKYGFL